MPLQLVDIGLHRLELSRRRDLARVHLRLDVLGARLEAACFVVEARFLAAERVALGRHRLRADRHLRRARSDQRERVAFGEGVAAVLEPVEREVVVLHDEQRLERVGHGCFGAAGAVGAGGAVFAGGAVVAGGAVTTAGAWMHGRRRQRLGRPDGHDGAGAGAAVRPPFSSTFSPGFAQTGPAAGRPRSGVPASAWLMKSAKIGPDVGPP